MIMLSYLCEGGHLVMFPSAGANIFGTEFNQVPTIMHAAIPASSMTSLLISKVFAQKLPTLQPILLMGAALSAINILILCKFDDKHFKKRK